MSDTHYVKNDGRDDLSVSDDEQEDSHEDQQGVKFRPMWAIWYDQYFGKLAGASDDDNSDALVCEGWDEPNYISADHGYYPDLFCYQCDSSSDEYQEPVAPWADQWPYNCSPIELARERYERGKVGAKKSCYDSSSGDTDDDSVVHGASLKK
jgi:hypothetical protein